VTTVNIGEISKPSVDRTQVDKKLRVDQPDPVLKTQVISDRVKLSEESQKRYQQESKKAREATDKLKSKVATKTVEEIETTGGTDDELKSTAIDLRV
jgi:hypothetical protein